MADIAFEKDLSVAKTGIGGLKVVDLAVHGDSRGWFKENWQRAKMCALGIPDLRVVQNNVSYNEKRGVTRGIHAEPWDKFISVARGSVFGAWVDLREGSATFGKVFTCTLDPSRAIYVPRGVGNSFQALEDGTAYTYLVDAHWSLELKRTYTFVNLADPELAIEWPIPLGEATVSEADLKHPMLRDVVPMAPKRTLVTGCNGQLGHAVRKLAEERGGAKDFDFCDIDTFDMSDPAAYTQYDWSLYGTVINCGAYTAVDRAETPEGRVTAWKANAVGPALLARTCSEHGITLVHVSSDYVFDGTAEVHTEDEPLSPLSVYGQTKAAGDIAVAGCPRHYIMRSSWVIGEGHNFVKTMKGLSDRVADPEDKLEKVTVVDDQLGRLTFTRDMAAAIFHVLDAKAPYGTYGCTGSGAVKSWADIARAVFEAANGNGGNVVPVSTADYYSSAAGPIAPRPVHSALDLSKLESAGLHMPDGRMSWGSTSRRSRRSLICECKGRRSLTAAFSIPGVKSCRDRSGGGRQAYCEPCRYCRGQPHVVLVGEVEVGRGSEFDNATLDEPFEVFGITRPLSKMGCPFDNAVDESANKTLKAEFVYREQFPSLRDLQLKLNDYVWWHNKERIHSTPEYMSPVEFRKAGLSL